MDSIPSALLAITRTHHSAQVPLTILCALRTLNTTALCIATHYLETVSVGSHVNSPFGTSAHDLLHPFATLSS
jgi:hypothetical protein